VSPLVLHASARGEAVPRQTRASRREAAEVPVLAGGGREQRAGVVVLGIGEDLAGGVVLDHAAPMHHRDSIAHLGRDPQVVGDGRAAPRAGRADRGKMDVLPVTATPKIAPCDAAIKPTP